MGSRNGTRFGEWLDITLSNQEIMGRTLAEKVGVHDSAVSRWRAGAAVPNMETVAKIAEVLCVEPLRLAVTADLIPAQVAGVEAYEPPQPTERYASVKRQIQRIRGTTEATRMKLLQAYEEEILDHRNTGEETGC